MQDAAVASRVNSVKERILSFVQHMPQSPADKAAFEDAQKLASDLQQILSSSSTLSAQVSAELHAALNTVQADCPTFGLHCQIASILEEIA